MTQIKPFGQSWMLWKILKITQVLLNATIISKKKLLHFGMAFSNNNDEKY